MDSTCGGRSGSLAYRNRRHSGKTTQRTLDLLGGTTMASISPATCSCGTVSTLPPSHCTTNMGFTNLPTIYTPLVETTRIPSILRQRISAAPLVRDLPRRRVTFICASEYITISPTADSPYASNTATSDPDKGVPHCRHSVTNGVNDWPFGSTPPLRILRSPSANHSTTLRINIGWDDKKSPSQA